MPTSSGSNLFGIINIILSHQGRSARNSERDVIKVIGKESDIQMNEVCYYELQISGMLSRLYK